MNRHARSGSPILVDTHANTLDATGTSKPISTGSTLFVDSA
jgi:hypothetical protein